MEKKINIAELLKDCPKGMELDCAIWNGVKFIELNRNSNFPIVVRANNGYEFTLTKYGQVLNIDDAKCVIFPKGKTTWEGFQRPFKDGDVLSYQFKGYKNRTIYIYMPHSRMNTTYYVALGGGDDSVFMVNYKEGHALNGYNDTVRFATEEEKQKLFDAIKANGYKWDAETKTLEKLVEPKFKVGDKIKYKYGKNKDGVEYGKILSITDNTYDVAVTDNIGIFIHVEQQNDWELVHDKFDITTLKPFESRVLMRSSNAREWVGTFYSHYNNNKFYGCGMCCDQCIPYEGNEHLLGTTNDCDEFYKNW